MDISTAITITRHLNVAELKPMQKRGTPLETQVPAVNFHDHRHKQVLNSWLVLKAFSRNHWKQGLWFSESH